MQKIHTTCKEKCREEVLKPMKWRERGKMPKLLVKEVKKWLFSITKSLHKRHTGVA